MSIVSKSLQKESGFHCHCMREKDNLCKFRDISKGKLMFWCSRIACICESEELMVLTFSMCHHHFNRVDLLVASTASRVNAEDRGPMEQTVLL